jgi:hypothetical protein
MPDEAASAAPGGCYRARVTLPGLIRQIGYVVTDLDRAMNSWVALGVRPWFVIRGVAQRVTYRGQPCEITLSPALANNGDLQVELIQQNDATPSIFTEFLEAEGPDGTQTRFAYVEPPERPAAIIESR